MIMTIGNNLEEKVWRDFIDKHPQGNIFLTPEMFRVFASTKGHEPTLWAVIDDHQLPLALFLPVQITLKNGLYYHWTTRAVCYGGVLTTPGSDSKGALKLLIQEYQRRTRNRILFTELRNLFDLGELKPLLSECKFAFEDHLNFLINLDQSDEKLWHNIDRRCRQYINASKNKGVYIEEITDPEKMREAYQLVQKVYIRVQVPLAHISLFEAAYNILAPQEMVKGFIACKDNRYIGTIFILMHKRKIIGWYGGSDRDAATFHPGELLIWHILQWGREHGFHDFDFGGGGKPNAEYGPRNFKTKFGGELVNYGRNIYVNSPLRYQISKKMYSLAQRASAIKP